MAAEASAVHDPVSATFWFASAAAADSPGPVVGETSAACRVAVGAPEPDAVNETSCTGAPSGLDSTML